MKKIFTLKYAAIAALAVAVAFFLWDMRPKDISGVIKDWDKAERAWVMDTWVYADENEDRVLTDAEFAQFKQIMESATFTDRMYNGSTMWGRLYHIELYKDGEMSIKERKQMQICPSSEGVIYIGNYVYRCDKHGELWGFLESLDLKEE